MILVDKDIKKLGTNLIVNCYSEDAVGPVSYDVFADIFFKSSEESGSSHYVLKPNDFVMVKTKEKIHIPRDILGIIDEKNSLIRLGLMVTGPRYQPGHETYIYLRVFNASDRDIILDSGINIAQIFFERLTDVPDKCYNEIDNASFNNEDIYVGFGKYDTVYREMIK